MKYHSQNNEAEIVLNYFGNYKGTLLEIGANDGHTLSNSYDMIQAGWNAHLLEPSSTFKDLAELHKENDNVTCYNIGIGVESNTVPFYESGAHVRGGVDRGLVSSIHKHEIAKWQKSGVQFKKTEISLLTFNDFLGHASFNSFDYISIDTEGNDWQILQQIDLTLVGCRVLCIEWNGIIDLERVYSGYCAQFGLKEIHRNNENLIFAL